MLDGPVLCICLTATVGRHAWSWDLLVVYVYVDRLLRVMHMALFCVETYTHSSLTL